MPDPKTSEQLRGLVLSASEIKALTGWPAPMVEDYLNLLDNFITLAGLLDIEIDQKLEEVPTDFLNGSIPFVKDGFLSEDNPGLVWDTLNQILQITGIIASQGRKKNTTRVDTTPYTILTSDEVIYFDTDSTAITANLPAGVNEMSIKVINSGTSGNNVTLVPNGAELLNGVNESEFLIDTEKLILTYESTEGWY
jgi:hypothetical protein